MYHPFATYRLQFNKAFSFTDLEGIIPYLKQLGISTIYAAPVFTAVPGSLNGCDGTNPHTINTEIGTDEQLRKISKHLRDAGMGWLQDIAPDHMAFHPSNTWLMDVLEKGKASRYATFFDIDWNGGRIMVPFLSTTLEEAVDKSELVVALQGERYVFKYNNAIYPLNEWAQSAIKHAGDLAKVNEDKKLLGDITTHQFYRLCHEQETDEQINYRRAHNNNCLICLNIQDKKVFDEYHSYIKQLLDDGAIQGLRIAHIDSLYAPARYLDELQTITGKDGYVVVGKILQADEQLPANWKTQGTTGYDFLTLVNNLFTNNEAEEQFTAFYQQLTGDNTPVEEQIRAKKSHILYRHMGGELENLAALFFSSGLAKETAIDGEMLKQAIGEMLIACPAYRFYGNRMPLNETEEFAVRRMLNDVRAHRNELTEAADLLENALLIKTTEGDQVYDQYAAHFYTRCMQLSSSLMAKAVEDSLMYTYHRFITHNEIGDAPDAFGIAAEAFHRQMKERLQHYPLTINTTSTNDTKRGEDIRARLNVLSDLPGLWFSKVREWMAMNEVLKMDGAPDNNDEYFIYQTIAGAYPMPGQADDDLANRLKQYLQKYIHEAKINSGWNTPNEDYELATVDFATTLLQQDGPFMESFREFHGKVADYGIVNALAQLILKFTCPGVPDVYQGTELWDLSLADPDNRRAIDYGQRMELLQQSKDRSAERLWEDRHNGQIKLWLTNLLLQERNNHRELFTKGRYIPLKVEGKYKEHILAFARRHEQTWYIVVVPLHIATICEEQGTDIQHIDWRTTRVIPNDEMATAFEHMLSGEKGTRGDEFFIRDIFKSLPLALIKVERPNTQRAAGILLSVTSLPSPFGIGDLGPEAYDFADFLSKARQQYWQLLPINPTEASACHSPYSSYSCMAGNPLLISPDMLMADGLLNVDTLSEHELIPLDKANYHAAERIRTVFLDIAYQNFCDGDDKKLQQSFDAFCEEEAHWLNDMAVYTVLKQRHKGLPWYNWQRPYKNRDEVIMADFINSNKDAIRKIKFLQFLFFKQWKELKNYCNGLGILLLGDMPLYVSYDSADVWANRELFNLDNDGNVTIAGDHLNADTLAFNWNSLEETGYKWWVARFKKNMELFDRLTIDQFSQRPDSFLEVLEVELGKLPCIAEGYGDSIQVLQRAFGSDMPQSADAPHNYKEHTIVYTSTHNSNTTLGWYRNDNNSADHERMQQYLGEKVKKKNVHEVMTRMAYASIARTVIVPMQDILGLNEDARMNTPGQPTGNWLWRMEEGAAGNKLAAMLREWLALYNRG